MSVAEAVQAGVAGAAVCALAATLVARLVARLPEPEPDPELEADEGPKQPYRELAVTPGFAASVVWAAAAVGAVAGASLGWDWYLAVVLPVVPLGAALSVIDLRERLLPNRLVYPALALAVAGALVVWAVTGDHDVLLRGGLGYLIALAVYDLLWRISPSGLGYGDVRAAALAGFLLAPLGWPTYVVALWLSAVLLGVPTLVGALVRRDRGILRAHYPFGPFLLGAVPIGLAIQRPVTALLGS
jgi:leader peptidase (prepilin peptidase)/N-methyltransferase